jgi:ATP phosphoribosyltransferase regulatory subunit
VLVDLADARIVRSLFAGAPVDAAALARVHSALATKDASELRALTRDFPAASREGLLALVQLYGDAKVLDEAERVLPGSPAVRQALADLRQLSSRLAGAEVSFDLSDLRGYAYYSGMRFGIYVEGAADALVRGGRYDEVGAVFGRNRPAVGFSLDLRELVEVLPARPLRAAVRAPWSDAEGLRDAIGALRRQGETVVCVLPGHDSEIDEFHCDRELVEHGGLWTVKSI